MQLNIYVPQDKAHVIARLDEVCKALGRPKNEMVIEALERYLVTNRPLMRLPVRKGKVFGSLSREEIYRDRGLS
ncbi:MAG: hypothetical protein ACM3WU_07845 [Bacillota bacterium]